MGRGTAKQDGEEGIRMSGSRRGARTERGKTEEQDKGRVGAGH